MHAKALVILLAFSMVGTAACSGSKATSNVEAGAPDGRIADFPDATGCDQLASAAQTQFESYLPSTSPLACQTDSDCGDLDLESLNCFAPCGRVVRTADVSTLIAAAASVCDPYFGAGCPQKTPPCALVHAVCDHGTCAAASGRGGSSGSLDAAIDTGTGDVAIAGLDASSVDGGSEGGGSIQCSFPGASRDLTCAGGDYCMAFGGGPIDSGVSYTCEPFPAACLADRSCACLCSTATSGPSAYCAVRGQHCICSVSQGILTLLCAAP
jgi:hypothetical protein